MPHPVPDALTHVTQHTSDYNWHVRDSYSVVGKGQSGTHMVVSTFTALCRLNRVDPKTAASSLGSSLPHLMNRRPAGFGPQSGSSCSRTAAVQGKRRQWVGFRRFSGREPLSQTNRPHRIVVCQPGPITDLDVCRVLHILKAQTRVRREWVRCVHGVRATRTARADVYIYQSRWFTRTVRLAPVTG